MTVESIDKLRKLPYHGTNGFGSCVTASKETINQIADEIEAEISERYMPNPLDADGVPIRTGDIIEFGKKGERLEVTHIGWTKHGEPTIAYRRPNGTLDCSCIGTECRHVKPRTVEDVLREFTDEVWDRCCRGATASDSGIDELVAEFAAKLRLAGEDE